MGTPIAFCEACGSILPLEGQKTCGYCGHKQTGASPNAQLTPPRVIPNWSGPSAFTPPAPPTPPPAQRARLPILLAAGAVGLVLVVLAGALAGRILRPSSTADHAGWITFAPAGDGFTCKFPGTPGEIDQTISTVAGAAPTTVWTYSSNADLVYAVMLGRYPSGSMTGASPSAVYQGAIHGITNKVGGTVTATGTTALSGHPAETYTITGASMNMNIKGVMVLVGNNLYSPYVSYTATADMAEVDTFIADFDLTV